MKYACILLGAIIAAVSVAQASEPWEPAYAALLAKYATPEGVRYAAWKQNPSDLAALKSITDQLAAKGPSSDDRATRLAYHLNAYNLWMLQIVLDRYPITTVREIAPLFGVFTGKRIVLAGEKMSLNRLEKELIIKGFREPRIHFAINCASRSCPPLPAEPFTAARLEEQLEKHTREFASGTNPLALQIVKSGKEVELNSILKWYADDFAPAGGAIAFLNRYREDKLPEDIKVSFQDYDWSLNEAPST